MRSSHPQIEDYEPKRSLVVTPNKMVKFYADVRLPREAYPWSGKLLFKLLHLHNFVHHPINC